MTGQYIGWALVLGLAVGGALVWFAVGRIPRAEDEIPIEERGAEAAWISGMIADRGGKAPSDLVEEVLELHSAYVARDPAEQDLAT